MFMFVCEIKIQLRHVSIQYNWLFGPTSLAQAWWSNTYVHDWQLGLSPEPHVQYSTCCFGYRHLLNTFCYLLAKKVLEARAINPRTTGLDPWSNDALAYTDRYSRLAIRHRTLAYTDRYSRLAIRHRTLADVSDVLVFLSLTKLFTNSCRPLKYKSRPVNLKVFQIIFTVCSFIHETRKENREQLDSDFPVSYFKLKIK